jgi:DNA polymerase III subunit epsilon
MLLFFDTETSGLPKEWAAPVTDLPNWPRLVQIGWVCCDESGTEITSCEHLIQPVDFQISKGAIETHGITTEYAQERGADLRPILEEFHRTVKQANLLIGHNVSFDECIVGAEFLRAGMENVIPNQRRRCTMKESTDYCKLPGKHGYKWPSLTQLHKRLFDKGFADAHGALADCRACMRCFLRLRELEIIR